MQGQDLKVLGWAQMGWWMDVEWGGERALGCLSENIAPNGV